MGTSIISSCVVFSILGFLSKETGVPIEDVAKGGQGLAFIAYPEALSTVPLAPLWAILFFLMLFFLGLDSEFALLETVLTAIYDGFPKARAHKVRCYQFSTLYYLHFIQILSILKFFHL